MYQNYHQVFEQMYIPMLVLIFFYFFYVSNKEKFERNYLKTIKR